MIHPTQAQIEAAAKEIRVMRATVGNPTPENLAYAALTAAAQVGEPDIDGIETKLKWARSCAELDTIERCKQVVENIKIVGLFDPYRRKIAAALDKLKDAP